MPMSMVMPSSAALGIVTVINSNLVSTGWAFWNTRIMNIPTRTNAADNFAFIMLKHTSSLLVSLKSASVRRVGAALALVVKPVP